jgi:hypothetical protein
MHFRERPNPRIAACRGPCQSELADGAPVALEIRVERRRSVGQPAHDLRDVDQVILLAFAGMGLGALVLGLRKDRRWRFPLTAQIAFLALHSVVGLSPQTLVLRLLGFRTRQEIETERRRLLARERTAA